MDKKIFEVEISSGGPESYKTSAVLTMPCTQAELCDALQKARVQDVKTCRNELTRIRYPGITADMIGRNVDLLELNLLALRLTMLGEDDRMGLDGLLQIEKENHTAPFPLSRLINLTFNADICLLAPQVSNTQELGALLYEGEMLSEEAMALVDTMEEDSSFRERLLELLGEQHQEEHSGVFTSRGYAEPGSDFKEVYRKGEMFCFARPSAPVVLEVRKGFFDDPSYDNDKTTILNLPASDADIWRAVGEVDAASLDECAFRCIDCEIPSLRDAVDDAIEQEGGIGMASEFAANLAQKKQSWHEADWVKYKALLSVAGCPACRTPSSSCTVWTITTSDRMWPRPGIMRRWSCGRSTRICRRNCSRHPRPLWLDGRCWRRTTRPSPTMACSAGRTTASCRSSSGSPRRWTVPRWEGCEHAGFRESTHP